MPASPTNRPRTWRAALVDIAPPGLAHVFYSDSGSTAVEVALKMALGFWRNQSKARTRIIALEHAYHGDTIGTMSAGARGVFNAAYEPLLFDVVRLPFPAPGREQETLSCARGRCRKDAAALIVEPLMLGAGGMLIYSADVLRDMARDLRAAWHAVHRRRSDDRLRPHRHPVRLRAGRHRRPTFCAWPRASPAAACRWRPPCADAEIFEAHYSTDRSRTFFHSSSFTANPIACAAARANLEIWRDEPVQERIAALAGCRKKDWRRSAAIPRFANVRRLGTIAALDLQGAPIPAISPDVAPELMAFFHGQGRLAAPAGQYHLCHAALLRHCGGTRSGL